MIKKKIYLTILVGAQILSSAAWCAGTLKISEDLLNLKDPTSKFKDQSVMVAVNVSMLKKSYTLNKKKPTLVMDADDQTTITVTIFTTPSTKCQLNTEINEDSSYELGADVKTNDEGKIESCQVTVKQLSE